MGLGKLNPGCCGCGDACDCGFLDKFNREDSSTVGAEYTEVAGDWGILSNQLHVASGSALIDWDDSDYDRGCLSSSVRCKVKGADSGDELLLIAARSGSTPTIYVRLTVGASATLELVDTVNSQSISVDVTAAAGSFHTLEWSGCRVGHVFTSGAATLSKVLLNGQLKIFAYDNVENAIDPSNVSLGTGSLSNNAYFDDLRTCGFSSGGFGSGLFDCVDETPDPDEQCPDCTYVCPIPEELIQDELDLVLSGLGDSGCGQCNEANARYTLSRVARDITSDGGCARWELDGLNLFNGCTCGSYTLPVTKIFAEVVNVISGSSPPAQIIWTIGFEDSVGAVFLASGTPNGGNYHDATDTAYLPTNLGIEFNTFPDPCSLCSGFFGSNIDLEWAA